MIGTSPDYFGPEIRSEICLKLKVNLANYPPSAPPAQHIQIQIHPSPLSRPRLLVSPVLSQTESDGQHHELSRSACSNCSPNILRRELRQSGHTHNLLFNTKLG